MPFENSTESNIVFKIENINKGLSALNTTLAQLKGVSFIGDEKRTMALVRTATNINDAIGKEIDELKNIDYIDEAITKEVNEKLLALLREASFKLDDDMKKMAGQ